MEDPNSNPAPVAANDPAGPQVQNNTNLSSDTASFKPEGDSLVGGGDTEVSSTEADAELPASEPTTPAPESADFNKPAVDAPAFGAGGSVDGFSSPSPKVDAGPSEIDNSANGGTQPMVNASAAAVAPAVAVGAVASEEKGKSFLSSPILWVVGGVVVAVVVGVIVYFSFFNK